MNGANTIDIVFATTSTMAGSNPLKNLLHPYQVRGNPVKDCTHIHKNVYIGKCGQELWQGVIKACRPSEFSSYPVTFGQRYAFWNHNPADPSGYDWDPDQSLKTVVALSRLIYPTNIGFEYSARVRFDSLGQITKIIPGPVKGFLAHAYVSSSATRDWLTEYDAEALRQLLHRFYGVSNGLPKRIQRALWNHEYAAATQWMEVRWTVVATALEALIHTDREKSTQQFVDRVAALASRVGVSLSHQDAKRAYTLRSELAHGGKIDNYDSTDAALYDRMEAVLRTAIRVAIQDDAFREIFLEKDRIRVAFPLTLQKELSSYERLLRLWRKVSDEEREQFGSIYAEWKRGVLAES